MVSKIRKKNSTKSRTTKYLIISPGIKNIVYTSNVSTITISLGVVETLIESAIRQRKEVL